MRGRFVDMTGWVMKEHGVPNSKIIVLSLEGKKTRELKNGKLYSEIIYNCKCECGNIFQTTGKALRKGNTKTCGHCQERELIDKQFGRLRVINFVGRNAKGRSLYRCICSCGNEKIVEGHYLIAGSSRSCGCLQTETRQNNGRKNKTYNRYDLSGDYGIGFCSNTGREFYFDLEDYDLIKDYCWYEHIRTTGYHALETTIYENGKRTLIMTHLLGCIRYDHINHNSLDNRRSNLRPASSRQNNQNTSVGKKNTSGVLGVGWDAAHERWVAHINIPPELQTSTKTKNKYCETFREAVIWRLQWEREYYKEFAPQKHLWAEYGIGEN